MSRYFESYINLFIHNGKSNLLTTLHFSNSKVFPLNLTKTFPNTNKQRFSTEAHVNDHKGCPSVLLLSRCLLSYPPLKSISLNKVMYRSSTPGPKQPFSSSRSLFVFCAYSNRPREHTGTFCVTGLFHKQFINLFMSTFAHICFRQINHLFQVNIFIKHMTYF